MQIIKPNSRWCYGLLSLFWLGWFVWIAVIGIGVVGCSQTSEPVDTLAPVLEINKRATSKTYTVNPGDTLYSIAWAMGEDYRYLAHINRLSLPYELHPGQIIRLRSGRRSRPAIKVNHTAIPSGHNYSVRGTVRWHWPAYGLITHQFSSARALGAGIDIAGHWDDSIYACAPGQVVYSGKGIRGYGNLLIIKHTPSLLSAYAYNAKLLVKTGDRVVRGQTIARMGIAFDGKPALHFEVRYNGRPVNPAHYLPKLN